MLLVKFWCSPDREIDSISSFASPPLSSCLRTSSTTRPQKKMPLRSPTTKDIMKSKKVSDFFCFCYSSPIGIRSPSMSGVAVDTTIKQVNHPNRSAYCIHSIYLLLRLPSRQSNHKDTSSPGCSTQRYVFQIYYVFIGINEFVFQTKINKGQY